MATPDLIDSAPLDTVRDLVERFERNRDSYRAPSYGETEVRREFVDPFFKALGWDIDNERGYAEPYKDVVHEASVRVDGAPKAPDYSFRVGGTRKFFVETKKPSLNLRENEGAAFQLRRYGWSAGLPLSILTSFDELAVYDCRVQPEQGDRASVARILHMTFDEYLDRWDELADVFARESVLQGSFDRYAEDAKSKRGTAEVDEVFLEEIEGWRHKVARNFARQNPSLSRFELNFSVQRTIDRVIFLRICEDRGIEPYGQLREAAEDGDIYEELGKLFHHADQRYNSGLFHFRDEPDRPEDPDNLTLGLTLEDEVLRPIIEGLYYPESPYEFSVLPADILGQVYEQFLGSTIHLTDEHEAVVEQKPEVRKAGGVYYTPTFVVDYIVDHAIGPLLEGKRPDDVAELNIVDPACGSGHFLVHAYQYLLDWHLQWYVDEGLQYDKYQDRVREGPSGDPVLTTEEKRRILLNNIYGVDIDAQAVEVTKLSLLLKVLEGESDETLERQMQLFAKRALPDLGGNIACGNSLIEPDFYEQQLTLLDEEELYRINPFDWQDAFPEIMSERGGFDAVIGNPPYIQLEGELRDEEKIEYFREHYDAASYKLDTYHLFMERSLELVRDRGYVSMITPSNFLTNNYLRDLRRLLLTESRIDHIVTISHGVFDDAHVDNCIWLLQGGGRTEDPFEVRRANPVPGRGLEEERTSVVTADPDDKHALFTGSGSVELAKLWGRLSRQHKSLGDVAYVNFGKQLRSQKEHPDDIIEVDSVGEIPDEYRPCYTGKDIQRYELIWGGRACLDDRVARSGGTWNPDRQNATNKLLCRQVGEYPFWALDEKGYQVLNRAFMVNLKDEASIGPLALLGILNSHLLRALWLHKFYDQRQTFPKIKGTYLKKLPIPEFDGDEDELKNIEEAVRDLRSLVVKRRESKTGHQREVLTRQIRALDERIDRLVFRVYGIEGEEGHAVLEDLNDLEQNAGK